jgi:ComF family protein
MRAGLHRLTDLVFPPTCLLCGARGEGGRDLCSGCLDDLPRLASPCPRCALPLGPASGPLCGPCLRRAPVWDALYAAFAYGPPLDRLVHRLKYQGRLDAARVLGGLLAETLTAAPLARPEYLIPVPLHRERLRERGFNQALELARPIARALGVPLLPAAVARVRPTASQSGLNARMRRQNLRGAFVARLEVRGRHVAVVDDVVTTGSTVAAVTRSLKEAGAARVEIWALARAPAP